MEILCLSNRCWTDRKGKIRTLVGKEKIRNIIYFAVDEECKIGLEIERLEEERKTWSKYRVPIFSDPIISILYFIGV